MRSDLQAAMIKKQIANDMINKLHDFFWVYFDEKTAKNVKRHPSNAIPLIKEAIQKGSLSKQRLTVYGEALQNAVTYELSTM